MASMCLLAQKTTQGWSTTFVGETIGQDSLQTWSRGLELFIQNGPNATRLSSTTWTISTSSPIPVREVEAIYRHFGIEFSDAARAAAEQSHAGSKRGPRAPKHTYSLAYYGLTDEQVKDRNKG